MFETAGPVYQGSWGFKELTIGLIAILSRLFQRSNKNIKRSREQEPQQYIFVRIQATIAPYTPCPFVICRIDSVYLYTFNDLAYIYACMLKTMKFYPTGAGGIPESSQPFRRWPRDGFSHAQTREMMVGQLNCCINETWWSEMLDSMGI